MCLRLRWRPGPAAFWRKAHGSVPRPARLALLFALWGWLGLLLGDLGSPLPLPKEDGYAQVVTARDGRPLRAFADATGVWRYPVDPTLVSPYYLEALLTYEDRWFYFHPGVNPVALIRAFLQGLRHGKVISGGSTLTMQVARIIDPHERSLFGKAKQILRALQLEYHLSKEQILTLYLNHAPFGGVLSGVQAASYTYLGKGAQELSLAEAALLAVLPQAPSRLRPDQHPERALRARDKLLARLATMGVVTRAEAAAARLEPVSSHVYPQPRLAPLLAEHVRWRSRGKVQTTIDLALQQALEDYVADYVQRLPLGTSAAVLVVENDTLFARAYVGSSHYAMARRFGHVDMTRAVRSPGSTLKPFLYGLALDEGLIHSESLLSDAPRFLSDYRPANFGEGFSGPVSAAEALQRSLNVPAVQVLEAIGPGRFAAQLEHGGLGLSVPGGKPSLPVILGGAGVHMIELTGLYTALANEGLSGRVRLTEEEPLIQRRVLSPGAAWIVRSILLANPSPERLRGERWVPSPVQLAWKTGTSYGFRDAWSFGVGPKFTIGVWIGRPDGTPLPGHYGLVTAAPLLFTIANQLAREGGRFTPVPESVSTAEICWPLGRAASGTPPELCHEKRQAWRLERRTPPTLPDGDAADFSSNLLDLMAADETGLRLHLGCAEIPHHSERVALWPRAVDPWLPPARRRATLIPALHSACPPQPLLGGGPLHIIGLRDGQTIRSAGERAAPPTVRLQSVGGAGPRYWLLNGKLLYEAQEGSAVTHSFRDSGRYRLAVVDEAGRSDSLELIVEGR